MKAGAAVIRVWIVDADAMVRRVLMEQAERTEGLKVCGESADAIQALQAIRSYDRQNPSRPDRFGAAFYLLLGETAEGSDWDHELAVCREHLILDLLPVTGDRSYRHLVQARRDGTVDYLLKPFDFERLREGLKRYVRFRAECRPDLEVTQQAVDRLYGFTGTAAGPMAASEFAARLLQYARERGPAGFGANEAAQALQISRGTAKRYLDQLVRQHSLTVEARYASRGRPSHWYRMIYTKTEESNHESESTE